MSAASARIARLLGRLLGDTPAVPSTSRRTHARTEVPRPLSVDRVASYLTRRGFRFRVDDDGDLTGTWDGHRFWFLLLGPERSVLQVRGRWDRTLDPQSRGIALLAVNDWNRDRFWPKVYAREEEDGLAIYAEVSVDFEHGATDDQIGQTVSCGLGTGVQVFSSIGPLVPPDEE